ncbi:TPA: hypothetical protein RX572_004219 [Yersinia enterocolitica]|nr:hypothetical protein [Yersinia enterocolitica]
MAYVTNIKTVITYDLDNTTKIFTIPFEYLSRNFVVVTLIGQDRKILTNITDYTFSTSTQIVTNSAWGDIQGYNQIEIRRQKSAQERIVDFQNGSVLRANDLNVSSIQSLHLAEEARDLVSDTIGADNEGNLDARGRRIVNVGDAVSDGDAVTLRQEKAWGESALNQANRSKVEADKSAVSAVAAKASETNSKASEVAAKVSETNAKTSEVAAKASEVSATASKNTANTAATNAATSANASETAKVASEAARDRAILEADKLGNINTFAVTIAGVSVPTNDVEFKGAHVLNGRIETKGTNGTLIVDSSGLFRDMVTINSKGATALVTSGDILIGVKAGNNEGSQLNFNDKNNTGAGFIDVNSIGELRVVKQGQEAGEKMTWSNNNDLTIRSGRIHFASTSSGMSQDGNLYGAIWRGGSLHADVNQRATQGDNMISNAASAWSGSLTGGGQWDIGMPFNISGRLLGFRMLKDGRSTWMSIQLGPWGDQEYAVAGNGDMDVRFLQINGGTALRIFNIRNANLLEIQIWR